MARGSGNATRAVNRHAPPAGENIEYVFSSARRARVLLISSELEPRKIQKAHRAGRNNLTDLSIGMCFNVPLHGRTLGGGIERCIIRWRMEQSAPNSLS